MVATCFYKNKYSILIADEVCEKEIEVDGETATIILLDTWDAEVRMNHRMLHITVGALLHLSVCNSIVLFCADGQRLGPGALRADRRCLLAAVLHN